MVLVPLRLVGSCRILLSLSAAAAVPLGTHTLLLEQGYLVVTADELLAETHRNRLAPQRMEEGLQLVESLGPIRRNGTGCLAVVAVAGCCR